MNFASFASGTTLTKWLVIALGLILSGGVVYVYGWYAGYTQYEERLAKATEKLLEAEQALAKASVAQAGRDAQKVTQEVTRGVEARIEYDKLEPSPVDPVDCISDDQRLFIRSQTQP